MDAVGEFLDVMKKCGYTQGNLLGLLHVLIGRRIVRADGTVVSSGLTWREAASVLRRCRWQKEGVRELGQDPADLPPRNRQRFWYTAIVHAQVDSDKASQAGDRFAELARAAGYTIGPPPAS